MKVDDFSLGMVHTDVETWFREGTSEFLLLEVVVDSFIPNPWGLLQFIQTLVKFAYTIRMLLISEARWLLNVDFGVDSPIEGCCLDIENMLLQQGVINNGRVSLRTSKFFFLEPPA